MRAFANFAIACFAVICPLWAQVQVGNQNFDRAAAAIDKQVAESVQRLAQLRESIAGEKVPMTRRLGELETELSKARTELLEKTRLLDGRTLELGNLRNELKQLEDEATYLSNLLTEYARNWESGLHVAARQQHAQTLQALHAAQQQANVEPGAAWAAQLAVAEQSIAALLGTAGGTRFRGRAVTSAGLVCEGEFTAVGPLVFFRSNDGTHVGTAEQRADSSEPVVLGFPAVELTNQAAGSLSKRDGALPLDPTLGNARKVAAANETFMQHLQRGGPVVYPIVGLAGLALLVALCKWLALASVRRPTAVRVRQLLDAVAQRNLEAARRIAEVLVGPAGEMLRQGVEHLHEPRELVEEVMYERVLITKLRLQGWLPFIAITASSAPLLGLLGTVTGIMNTFSLMTLFGTGDVKTLSSGISEALITTELGLYVAIPALLLHSLLSRKAKAVMDDMEKSAIALLNQSAMSPPGNQAPLATAV